MLHRSKLPPSILTVLIALFAGLLIVGIYLTLKEGDSVDVSGQAALMIEKEGVFEVAGYKFDYPKSWTIEDLGSTNGDTLVQFRDADDVIMMNLACPALDLSYEVWRAEDTDQRTFKLDAEGEGYLVSYKYLVPLEEGISSIFTMFMDGGAYDCAIYAQDAETRLDTLKDIYESVQAAS